MSKFQDNKGWYPGIEVRGDTLFFRDVDASTVLPNQNNEPYSVRVVDQDGNPRTDLYGLDVGLGISAGNGQPDEAVRCVHHGGEGAPQQQIARIRVQPSKVK